MKINKTTSGTELTIALDGRLDTVTAPQLDAELVGLDSVKKLIINVEHLSYISSAGLRVLLNAQKRLEKAGGSMVVSHAGDEIMEIFEITGFDEILTIEA